ncbi:MAG: NADH-quinone oxidoreductase subunit H, partial [Elusimicrobia bacterium]|nr:NADH-quinone oxidoreductase subunit H [Elusimicrobiota bacterium]
MSEEPKPDAKAPAAKAAPAKKTFPPAKFNEKAGRLLKTTRYWPTELWANPWNKPSYRRGALLLGGIILGLLATGAAVGELAVWGDRLYAWLLAFISARGGSPVLAQGIWAVFKGLLVLHVILLNGLWAVWWERKISAHIQSRVGPV